jgi:hypothetical protein
LNGNLSICAGIRWLFQKQNLASHKLKKETSWTEALVEYKGLDLTRSRDQKILNDFIEKYGHYKECKK